MFSDQEIIALRKDTPGTESRIHLNNAGASLMPTPVLKTIKDHLDLEANIGGYEAATHRAREVRRFYKQVAMLLNTEARNIAFTSNATDAYARAILSIPFTSGDTILTSSNDYVSNFTLMITLQNRFGVKFEIMKNDAEGCVDLSALERQLTTNPPRLLSLTHVPTNSGLIQPAEEVGHLCTKFGVLYLLDACQSIGQLPLDVKDIKCDFLSATFRKFLRGPRGAGFLYVSDRVLQSDYHPIMVDMRGATWVDDASLQLSPDASRFEDWENAYALMLGASVAVKYAMSIGLPRIRNRVVLLSNELREGLQKVQNIRILDRGREKAGLVTFNIKDGQPGSILDFLIARKINCGISEGHVALLDFRQKSAGWALRFSPHYFNIQDEVSVAIDAVKDFANQTN
ncbi:MAG: aminotransferase class V-fold PLP-dependent enzyme [Saprospiraceae bacterium]|nr:aminotransferase class V-fold PLP-dependent enzyme [Saprospiraceae bacterium]